MPPTMMDIGYILLIVSVDISGSGPLLIPKKVVTTWNGI